MKAVIVQIVGDTLYVERKDETTWKYPVKPHEPTYGFLGILRERQEKGWDELAIGIFEPVNPEQKKSPLKLTDLLNCYWKNCEGKKPCKNN